MRTFAAPALARLTNASATASSFWGSEPTSIVAPLAFSTPSDFSATARATMPQEYERPFNGRRGQKATRENETPETGAPGIL
ncbi:hypothetical protein [Streptomyces sp. NPDC058307]|uniref:hypothetical protein n=1 Tax=Streptomyces sp. NPDC058307 TaxID=3346439 RepID=UPI0036E36EA1